MARRFKLDNISPGTIKGTKAKKIRGRLLPRNLGWDPRTWTYVFGRSFERNISPGKSYEPKSKPTKRREKRGQSKPR